MEYKPLLMSPAILGSMPTPNGIYRNRHRTNVRLCNHYSVMHVIGTSSAVIMLGQIDILHWKHQTLFQCRHIHLIAAHNEKITTADGLFECFRTATFILFWHCAVLTFCYIAHTHSSLCHFKSVLFHYMLFCPMLLCCCATLTPCCFDIVLFCRVLFCHGVGPTTIPFAFMDSTPLGSSWKIANRLIKIAPHGYTIGTRWNPLFVLFTLIHTHFLYIMICVTCLYLFLSVVFLRLPQLLPQLSFFHITKQQQKVT